MRRRTKLNRPYGTACTTRTIPVSSSKPVAELGAKAPRWVEALTFIEVGCRW